MRKDMVTGMKQYQLPQMQISVPEEQDILTLSRIDELGEMTELDFEDLT